ncbi:protein of unknown function DUF975 [Clostridium sp. DL-VIII]|uniref:DUF975 family protein n=1 Tax=Clostridium sp. DL-VIII TaxID=641107 RepID=UPI00023B0745|nr:DUF975 family protein [Clostridium sp. DL-VIII]EHJ01023.1 protein of unknown function DUF975 [Clostridium sp. DL-VIII]
MEVNCKRIKNDAISSLRGNWTVAIVSAIVYNFIRVIGDVVSLPGGKLPITILTIISDGIFIFGFTAIILHIIRGEQTEVSEIFIESKRFLKGLGMTLATGILTFLWSLLLIVPGIIAAIKYSMTFYIWVDNPNIGISEAIDKSIEMTNGHRWDVFKLYLSFIGWFILILILTFIVEKLNFKYYMMISSIGMIPLGLYVQVSMAVFYDKLLKDI